MTFKNYLLFRLKTYGIGIIGLFLAATGLFATVENVIIGLVMLLLGGLCILYVRYEWREHDIRLEQRKFGR